LRPHPRRFKETLLQQQTQDVHHTQAAMPSLDGIHQTSVLNPRDGIFPRDIRKVDLIHFNYAAGRILLKNENAALREK
jgi:hypothetical protein